MSRADDAKLSLVDSADDGAAVDAARVAPRVSSSAVGPNPGAQPQSSGSARLVDDTADADAATVDG